MISFNDFEMSGYERDDDDLLLRAISTGGVNSLNALLSQGHKFTKYTWDGTRLKDSFGRVFYDFTETEPIEEDDIDDIVPPIPSWKRCPVHTGKKSMSKYFQLYDLSNVSLVPTLFVGRDSNPLFLAVKNGYIDMLAKMISEGQSVESHDINKRSLLQSAAMYSQYKIVKFLLALGANPNSCDAQGWTPLTNAYLFGNIKIIGLLLFSGADQNIRDQAGCLPINCASQRTLDALAQTTNDASVSSVSSVTKNDEYSKSKGKEEDVDDDTPSHIM